MCSQLSWRKEASTVAVMVLATIVSLSFEWSDCAWESAVVTAFHFWSRQQPAHPRPKVSIAALSGFRRKNSDSSAVVAALSKVTTFAIIYW